jgi:hypothetical protein
LQLWSHPHVMLLARHSLSLVCANSQRDFFTNCTSIWSLGSFLTTCCGVLMTSFHVFYQDSYIAMSDSSPIIDILKLTSPAILVQSFTMTWMNKNLWNGPILLSWLEWKS